MGNVLLYLIIKQDRDSFIFQRAFKIINIFRKIKLTQRFKSRVFQNATLLKKRTNPKT